MNTRRTAPTPPGLPFLGNLHQWFREPFDAPVRWHREYGDVVRLNTPTAPIYLVNSPDLIEEVLVRRWREFRKDALTRALDMALGQGLVTSEGDRWVRHRRLVQPAFSKARMQAYMETMATVAHEHVATWQDGRTYDLLDEFNALTFRIVVKTLFDTEVTDDMSVVWPTPSTSCRRTTPPSSSTCGPTCPGGSRRRVSSGGTGSWPSSTTSSTA
jgi:cytochrome P450